MAVEHIIFEYSQDMNPALYKNSFYEAAYIDKFVTPNLFRFKTQFLSRIKKKTFYIFIIAAHQSILWKEHLDRYDLGKYIVWQTDKPSLNEVYPGSPPKLHMYILNFPEGWNDV